MARKENTELSKPRAAFLLALAAVITFIFLWMIKGFVMALIMAAILSALVYPLYSRFLKWFRGRKSIASGLTVLLSLLLVIVPIILFIGVLVGEAVNIAESAQDWVEQQVKEPSKLSQQIEANPVLSKLIPYKDKIIEKAAKVISHSGSWLAKELAAGAMGTAHSILMLFVMLFAMFFFLMEGKEALDSALQFTPLREEDKTRMLSVYASVGRATIKGTMVIGVVQGALAGLSFWVGGIEGALFWGTVMAVLSIIPGIGTALIWVPAVIYLAATGHMGAAVGIGLWCALVVGTIDNILRPILVGKDTEMSDLLVLLTTLGGLSLFGPAGIILGPIIGALFKTIWELWGSAVKETGETVEELAEGRKG